MPGRIRSDFRVGREREGLLTTSKKWLDIRTKERKNEQNTCLPRTRPPQLTREQSLKIELASIRANTLSSGIREKKESEREREQVPTKPPSLVRRGGDSENGAKRSSSSSSSSSAASRPSSCARTKRGLGNERRRRLLLTLQSLSLSPSRGKERGEHERRRKCKVAQYYPVQRNEAGSSRGRDAAARPTSSLSFSLESC